jgi:hypothetical protein
MRRRSDDEIDRENEIVADIIEAVEGVPESLVRGLIDDLRTEIPPLTGNQRVNTEAVRGVRKAVAGLKRKINALPAPVRSMLSGEITPLCMWQNTAIEVDPDARKARKDPTGRPIPPLPVPFLQPLAQFDQELDGIEKLGLGRHKGVRYQQERAAMASRAVMAFAGERRDIDELVTLTGERAAVAKGAATFAGAPLTCAPDSLYCRVAALFYEAVSGKSDQDLRRACTTVARQPQRRPDAQS